MEHYQDLTRRTLLHADTGHRIYYLTGFKLLSLDNRMYMSLPSHEKNLQ